MVLFEMPPPSNGMAAFLVLFHFDTGAHHLIDLTDQLSGDVKSANINS
jgi:hypothetical protein